MRRACYVLLLLMPLSSMSADLSIERIFGDPALAGPTPHVVKVSPDGRRVGILRGSATDQHQLDLWTYDVKDSTLQMRVDSKKLAPDEQLSDAERARRERERVADYHGIVNYDWAPDSHHVLFTLNGNLFLYDLDQTDATALRQLTHGAQSVLDPQVSPRGRYVSFVRDQNLWVIDLGSGEERRLTTDGGGNVHNAEAEFIAQEEMGQSSGYWWAPDDSAIAYKRFDESAVPIARRFEIYAEHVDVVEQRYPAAGEANVSVKLGLVSPTSGDATRWIDLGANQDIYLVRADWTPNAKQLAFQRLSRDQKRLDLVLVNVETLAQATLITENSKTWVNLHDDLRFLKHQPALIWSSERDGSKQLYLVGLDGKVRHPLTAGTWQVDHLLAADETSGRVYFDSNKDAVVDEQIYTVGLDGRDASHPHRISHGDGWHVAQFAQDAQRISLYVDTFSDPLTPPQVSINAPDGHRLAWIEANPLDSDHPYWPYHEQHVVPEFGHIKATDGQQLNYSLMKPPGFDPSRRYPVFVTVYGGPTVQVVSRQWPSFFNEYMAQHGYIVFELDNRGSSRRNRAFQDPIHLRLGNVEVQDQLAGMRWLQTQPWVDAKHIGVFGWSYGGYMTLMLLAKGSDVVAAGAAVAPVTDWRLYDTCYTERYLGLPQDNQKGYDTSAVFSALDGLKSPLLLAHGMADDNVLFVNSTRLMSELQKRGVQFQLMTYPGAKHGLSTPQMKIHVYTAIQRFFDAHLKDKS